MQQGHISGAIASLLPEQLIRRVARELGAVKRERKVDIVQLVYSVVLGFAMGHGRTVTGLRRAFEFATGKTVARSSFHERFSAALVALFERLTNDAMEALAAKRPKLRDAFSAFLEVLAIDSTFIRLHPTLKEAYPSVWSNNTPAAAKLTMVANVVGRGPRSFRFVRGSLHDANLLDTANRLRGRLLLFDLGFSRAELFKNIDARGGYFLTRFQLRNIRTPVIFCNLTQRHPAEQTTLEDLEAQCKSDFIDVQAKVGYYCKQGKRKGRQVAIFRIVCVYNHAEQRWHRYVTNVSVEMLAARAVTAVYAARWEIELLFRELKSSYRICDMPSSKLYVSQVLLHASLLTLMVSQKIRQLVQTSRPCARKLPDDRWARLFHAVALELLRLVLRHPSDHSDERKLLAFLGNEAPDPNRSRKLLPERAQDGKMAFA